MWKSGKNSEKFDISTKNLEIFKYFGNFEECWKFWKILEIWKIFRYLESIWKFEKILNILRKKRLENSLEIRRIWEKIWKFRENIWKFWKIGNLETLRIFAKKTWNWKNLEIFRKKLGKIGNKFGNNFEIWKCSEKLEMWEKIWKFWGGGLEMWRKFGEN